MQDVHEAGGTRERWYRATCALQQRSNSSSMDGRVVNWWMTRVIRTGWQGPHL